jgi:hypothetical protein
MLCRYRDHGDGLLCSGRLSVEKDEDTIDLHPHAIESRWSGTVVSWYLQIIMPNEQSLQLLSNYSRQLLAAHCSLPRMTRSQEVSEPAKYSSGLHYCKGMTELHE